MIAAAATPKSTWRNPETSAFRPVMTVMAAPMAKSPIMLRMMLTITAVFYALGRLPLPLVGLSVLLAAGAFGFGLYARRRAERFDADLGNGPPGH